MYTREELIQIAREAANYYGIDPDLFVAQINQESGFQTGLTSPAGAQGIAQIMPATAQAWGVDPNDPVAALYTAAREMANYQQKYGVEGALIAYNAGEGTAQQVLAGQASLPAETNHYMDAILAGGSVGPGAIMPPTQQGGSCYDAMGNPVACSAPNAVYDSNFEELDSVTKAGYQGANLPGLVFDPNTGTYVDPATGQKATPQQISSALNDMGPAERARIAETARGNDLQYGASIYSSNVSAANSMRTVAEQARQFDISSAQAKEQFLWQKQNDIAQLELQQQQLATTQAQNARMYVLEQQNLQFLQNKFAFESSLSLRQEERATQAQLFGQQATVAGLQLEMESITQSARNLQAQLNQEVAIFNAAKAADVSMFNIDQQTKTAMFNSEGKFNADSFNAQMGFNVARANKEEERFLREEQMRVAQLISEAAADPGDRGKLASLIQALSGQGFGGMDAALATTDLRTADSLAPLDSFLRTREQIQAADTSPYEFTPISFTPVQAGQATFTPAKAAQVQMPNFSGVQMPVPNTTPFNPASIPTTAPRAAPTADSTTQNFIASGNTTASTGQQFHQTGGATLSAEQRAQMMQNSAVRDMLMQQGLIPALAEGGQARGAYIGDERGPELHIPFFQGGRRMQRVVNAGQTRQMLGGDDDVSAQPINPPEQASNRQFPNFGGMPQFGNFQMPQMDGQIMGRPAWDVMMNGINYNTTRPPAPPAGNPPAPAPAPTPEQPAMPQFNLPPQVVEYMQRMGFPMGNLPQMAEGGIVEGAYVGNDDGDAMHIPIPGTNMTIIMPKKDKSKSKGMKKMADGGIFANAGRSIFEGLVDDTDRTRAMDFLEKAGQRATAQTPFDINRLPTPVFASSPGSSRFLTDLLGSLNALKRGIPLEYFREQAALQRPVGYQEGVIGRSR